MTFNRNIRAALHCHPDTPEDEVVTRAQVLVHDFLALAHRVAKHEGKGPSTIMEELRRERADSVQDSAKKGMTVRELREKITGEQKKEVTNEATDIKQFIY